MYTSFVHSSISYFTLANYIFNNVSLTRVVRDLWSDVLRSRDDGIGMTVGLELSQPARQCDDKLTASVGSKLARLWGLNLYGESSDDRGTLTLKTRETN